MKKLIFLISFCMLASSVSCSTVTQNNQNVDTGISSEPIEKEITTGAPKPDVKITMSCFESISEQLQNTIDCFNAENNGYSIILKDYSPYLQRLPPDYSGDDLVEKTDEFKAEFKKKYFNDIAKNNGCDIICSSTDLAVLENLKKSGNLIDLYELFEKDKQADISQYTDNIINLCENNDKLYEFSYAYGVNTLIGIKEYIGKKSSWTINDVINCCNSLPEDISLTESNSREQISYYFVNQNLCSYVDDFYGERIFHSDELRNILNFCMNARILNRTYNGKIEPYFIKDLEINSFNKFHSDIKSFEKINGESTIIGFPSDFGYSANMYTIESFAICNNSSDEKKAGAWEFLKYAVSEESQMNLKNGLPVNNKAFDDMAKQNIDENKLTERENNMLLKCVKNVKLREDIGTAELREISVYDLSDLVNYHSISIEQAVENINNKLVDYQTEIYDIYLKQKSN